MTAAQRCRLPSLPETALILRRYVSGARNSGGEIQTIELMSNSLALFKSLSPATAGGVSIWNAEKGNTMPFAQFLANLHGITMQQVEAHQATMPLATKRDGTPILNSKGEQTKQSLSKACQELVIAKGVDKAEIKKAMKEFDGLRDGFHVQSRKVTAALCADPTLKISLRESKNRKGETIGGVATIRRDRKSSSSVISAYQTQLAALQAKLDAITKSLPVGVSI